MHLVILMSVVSSVNVFSMLCVLIMQLTLMIKGEEKVRKWGKYWEKDNHWHVQVKLHLFIII